MIWFIIGLFVGAFIGIAIMVLFQVNKNEAEQNYPQVEEEGCTCGDDSHHGSKEHLATFKLNPRNTYIKHMKENR